MNLSLECISKMKTVSEWLLFYAKMNNFSAILWREQVTMTWWWCPLCTGPIQLIGSLQLWFTEITVRGYTCRSIPTHYPHSEPTVFILTYLGCVLSREASNANVIVFGLTRLESEPTIYHTRSEHANHYTAEIEPLLKLKERRYQLGNKKP
jgi:hypothetical protein